MNAAGRRLLAELAGTGLLVMGCQVTGAVGGAALANAMFAVPVLAASSTRRGGGPVLLGEVVATAGLLLLIVTLARTGRTQHPAWAAGAWIGAAYWFTSSTSFANPAVTIGRTLTPTYAGIAPASAPAFIAAEIVGGGLGGLLAVAVHPARPGRVPDPEPARLAAGRVRVSSAGSEPASELNPAVVQAMAEIGLDISAEFPKPLDTGKVQAADIVITMGRGDACPVYPGQRYLDWDLPDPAGLRVEQVRPIRDEISARVRALISELDA